MTPFSSSVRSLCASVRALAAASMVSSLSFIMRMKTTGV